MWVSLVEHAFPAFAGELVHEIHQVRSQVLSLLPFCEIFDDAVGVFALLLVQVLEELQQVSLHLALLRVHVDAAYDRWRCTEESGQFLPRGCDDFRVDLLDLHEFADDAGA